MESFSCDRERGQVLALCSVFLVVLLGFAAMAVYVGSWYVEKHKLQSAADAAALAGAGHLPAGFAVAQATASAQFNKNKTSGDAAAITNVTTNTANDTVQVIATGTAPSFFAKVFGHDQTNLRVTAKAVIRTVTSFSSTGNVMPFGVMKGSYTPGTSYTIYGDGSSSNNGALSLDIISGSNCATVNGSNEVKDTITGADRLSDHGCRTASVKPVTTPARSHRGSTAACPGLANLRPDRHLDRQRTVTRSRTGHPSSWS